MKLLLVGLVLTSMACGFDLSRLRGAQPAEEAQAESPSVVEVAEAAEAADEAPKPTEPPSEVVVDAVPVNISSSDALRDAVTVDGIRVHLTKLQEVADANDGNRASGTLGHEASAAYVREQLEAAGYLVTEQTFEFPFFQDATEMAQVSPLATPYDSFWDFAALQFTPAGDVTATVQPVALSEPLRSGADSGCQASDFDGFEAGNIALVKRGVCTFADKAANAEAAGAVAILVFNDGTARDREDVVRGTLGEGHGVEIPVVGLSFEVGEALYEQSLRDAVALNLTVDIVRETRETVNIIADTPGGRDDFIVVVGGHLDSVSEGPGIHDNGSGTMTILEIALQMAALGIEPMNKVRFAFWGAEEFGLLGSQYYVDELSRNERAQIALNLNFDMIASPNYVRFVYDGDQSQFRPSGVSAPKGSGAIEQVFQDYFAAQDLELAETPFAGRSDYGPFIEVRIPAGGLFTGAESVKKSGEVNFYGGTDGEAYDACYHRSCDNIDNINWQAVDEMSDAAAHAVMVFAMTTEPVEVTVSK